MSILIPEVRDLAMQFTDWHIDLKKPDTSILFRAQQRGADGQKSSESMAEQVPSKLEAVVTAISKQLVANENSDGPRSLRVSVEDMWFRAERMRPNRYALRYIKGGVRTMPELGLPPDTVKMLMEPDYRTSGGLILISGEAGAGKTTTAASTVVARLNQFGGYCLSVEAPIEYELEGFHGKGYIEQIDASQTGFKIEVASAMRKFPTEIRSMFYFGEVLEETAAAELVRLIGRGHLVITTIHANDAIGGISMLIALAERGGETYAREMVGKNLCCFMHQKLSGGTPIVVGMRSNESVKNIISNKTTSLQSLKTELEAAKAKSNRELLKQPPRMV